MNDWSRKCWLCGRNGAADPLDEHHVFFGWSNRRVSVEYDITVPLCHDRCHENGPKAAHNCKATADMIKRYGQRKVMLEQGWTVEEFRLAFGKNYLDEDEIEEIYAIQRGETTEAEYSADDFCETEEVLPEWIAA